MLPGEQAAQTWDNSHTLRLERMGGRPPARPLDPQPLYVHVGPAHPNVPDLAIRPKILHYAVPQDPDRLRNPTTPPRIRTTITAKTISVNRLGLPTTIGISLVPMMAFP